MSKDLLVALFQAVDTSDWAALEKIYAPAVVYERPGYGPFLGRERVIYFYRCERLIQGTHLIEAIVASDNQAACWGRFVGRKQDGTEVDERFADVYGFEQGKITTRRTYFFRPAI
jgi:ketosteroid isomerase-like protein